MPLAALDVISNFLGADVEDEDFEEVEESGEEA
jgi:hypothetical protein